MEKAQGAMQGLRISTQIEQEAERILRNEGISPPVPIISEKCGQGVAGNVPLTTNVYGVMMKQIPIYRYDIKISADLLKKDGTTKRLELTKKTKGDAVMVDRRSRCRDVYLAFSNSHRSFLQNPKCVYYDLQSIIYSLNRLAIPEGVIKFTLPSSKLGKGWEDFKSCEIEIRPVTEGFQLTLGDFSRVSRDLTQSDHSMAQFLDIATSQYVMLSPKDHISFSANNSFLMNYNRYGFKDFDVATFHDNGSFLAIGAKKSIHFVEGPAACKGKNVALVVETKKTPFHMMENLVAKASRLVHDIHNMRNGDFNKLDKILSGLYVETKHLGRFQRFLVKGLDQENAKTKLITIDDVKLSVAKYYLNKYNINLKEPLLPLVISRGKEGNLSFFPMELCTVVDNQRLKTNQQTSKQVQEMIRKCAVPPAQLREQNGLSFNSLNLLKDQGIKNAQISISDHPLALNGRHIPAPDLEYKNRFISKVRIDNFTWIGKQFLIPAACSKWAAIALLNQQDRLLQNEFENFVDRFVNEANSRLMKLPKVEKVKIMGSDIRILKTEFERMARVGIDFVLLVHADGADDVHGTLKLHEREYSIVTQAIRYGTLMNMIRKGQPQTLQNIVNKTNIKMGGLNYTLSLESASAREALGTGALYIGFGMNHAGGGMGANSDYMVDPSVTSSKIDVPSIVGYAANYGLKHEFEFVGDFVCQKPQRDEKVEIIRTVVTRCLEKYRANRKADPKKIVIFRNGCGEGQFPMILKYEVPLIKLAMQKKKCSAGLTVIVSNKLQGIRFFAKDIDSRARASDQNIKPGLVVDYGVVHPEYSEFFLTSHRALQGTARTPKYTVLVNENRMALEQLERITYQLCFGHQIVYMPTSLPSPVYIANRYAERGRKLYQRWIKSPSTDNTKVDYNQMTNQLSYYEDQMLSNRRVNA